MANNVAIRLAVGGGAEARAQFEAFKRDGQAAFGGVGDVADATARRVTNSYLRSIDDVEAANARMAAAAAKIAAIAPKSAVQMTIEGAAGSNARGGVVEQAPGGRAGGQYEGSAKVSATAFSEMFEQQDRAEASALKLRAALNPLYAAEIQLARAMEEVALAERAGILTSDEIAKAQGRAQAAFDAVKRSADEAGQSFRMGDNADAQVRSYWQAAAAEQERAQATALKLKAAIDPLWAAEQQHLRALEEIAVAERAGILTAENLTAARIRAQDQLDAVKRGNTLSTNVRIGDNADAQVGAYRQQIADQERYAATAAKIRAALHPTWEIQKQLNRELYEAQQAYKAGALGAHDYEAEAQRLRAEMDRLSGSDEKQSSSVNQRKAGLQQLGFQIQDVTSQAATGTSALVILAQQGGQMAQAFELIGPTGKAGKFAAFMGGPYGAAILAAVSIGGMLIASLLKTGDATDEAVSKLKEDAKQSEVTAKANAIFARSAEGVTSAILAMNDELKRAGLTERQVQNAAYNAATAHAAEELAIRKKLQATLEWRREEERAMKIQSQGPGQRGELATLGLPMAAGAVAAVEAALAANQAAITKAEANVRMTGLLIEERRVAEAMDASTAAAARYEQTLGRLRLERQRNQISAVEYRAQLQKAQRDRDAAVKAEQDRVSADRRSETDNRQTGRQITVADAKDIIRGLGGVVTSSVRSTERQAQLYAAMQAGTHNGPVARPGTSDHETGRAVDVAYGPGISIATIRQAFRAQGIALKQVLDEPGQRVFHVAWSKATDATAESMQRAGKAARDEKRDLDALQGSLDTFQSRLDPLAAIKRTAMDDKAVIAKGLAAKLIDPATAGRYSTAIDDEAAVKRAAALRTAIDVAARAKPIQFDAAFGNDETQAKADQRAATVKTMLADQSTALLFAREEGRLVGANDNLRETTLQKLQLILNLKEAGIAVDSEDGVRIIANADALEALATKTRLASDVMSELRGFGEGFVNTVLSKDTWSSWGNAGKAILGELKSEFIKLALLNPLKNLLNGDSAMPTLGGVFGKLTGLLGGKGLNPLALAGNVTEGVSTGILAARSIAPVGFNAIGSEYWSGGATWVGENGPEIIDAPRGARITPASESRRVAAVAAPTVNHFDLRGAVMTQDLLNQMNAIGAQAESSGATRGTYGGAQMAQAEATSSARRKLGRNW